MQALRFGRSGNLPASSMARLGLVAPLLVVLSYAVHTSDAAGGTTLSAPQASGVRGPSAAQDAKSQDAEPGEVEISDQDPRMETEEYIIHTGPLTVSIFGHRPVKPFDVAATPTALPSHAKQATVPQTEAAQETHGDPSGMNRPMRLSAAAVQTALTQRLFELHAAGPNPRCAAIASRTGQRNRRQSRQPTKFHPNFPPTSSRLARWISCPSRAAFANYFPTPNSAW